MKSKKKKTEKKAIFKANPEHIKFLKKVAKKSSIRAIKENKALNLPITYYENGSIFREFPDGKRIEIGKI